MGSTYEERQAKKRENHEEGVAVACSSHTDFNTIEKPDTNTQTSQSNRSLRIMQWNAQSIGNKADILRLLLSKNSIDLACISETRIQNSENWKHKLKGYTLYNAPRPDREGGGVCIIARSNFGVTNVTSFYSNTIEYILADVVTSKDCRLSLTSVYARSGCNNIADELSPCIKKKSLILGDFNAKHVTWGSSETNMSGTKLLEWMNNNNVIVLNQGQHTYQNHSSGLSDALDVSIASPDIAEKVARWNVLDDSFSDHFPIIVQLNHSQERRPIRCPPKWNISRANRSVFIEKIQSTTKTAMAVLKQESKHINVLTDVVTSCIVDAAEASYPVSKPHMKTPTPWWNEEIALAIKEKRKARRKWLTTNTVENKINYKRNWAIVKLK